MWSPQVVVLEESSPFWSMAMCSMKQPGGGVPVFFPRRGIERLARVDFDDLSVPGTEAPDTLGDAQILTVLVGVPGRAYPGGEPDGRDDHRLVVFVGKGDRVKPDVTGELCRRVLGGRHQGFDVHVFPICCVLSTFLETPMAGMLLGQPARKVTRWWLEPMLRGGRMSG